MKFRISPAWWPLLIAFSPVLVPLMAFRNKKFLKDQIAAADANQKRIIEAELLELPEAETLQVSVLVDFKAKQGFTGEAGVSYLFKTDKSSLLYDIAFGASTPALAHNAEKLGITNNGYDALAISHLHADHMGGLNASRSKTVMLPDELMPANPKPCYLPDNAATPGFNTAIVDKPQLLTSDIASTGPLARRLFFLGMTEEQAIVIRLKGKGLVVFAGCGHPTIETILRMVRKMSNEPIYAIGGGFHFPINEGRISRAGIQIQTVLGTGKQPWKKIKEKDLTKSIEAINEANPKLVFLSGHDSSDYALTFLKEKLNADTYVLEAGETYTI